MPPRGAYRHKDDRVGSMVSLTPGAAFYGRGSELTLPRLQFQLLYREVGFAEARAIAIDDGFVLWPYAPPPDELLRRWCWEVDKDEHECPENVERAFRRRWENYAKALAIKTVRGTSKLSRDFTALASEFFVKARAGEVDKETLGLLKDTTSLLMHANNGTGFIYREIVGTGKKAEGPQQINNFLLNAGAPPQRKRKPIPAKRLAAGIPAAVEVAEYREVT